MNPLAALAGLFSGSPQTGTTPYNYALAQRMLGQRYAMAQALMNSQAPSGEMIPGATSKGSGGGWFVPNTGGMIASALKNVLGAEMMSGTNTAAAKDVQNQQSAVTQALAGVQPQLIGDSNLPETANQVAQDKQISSDNANAGQFGGLKEISTNSTPYQAPVYSQPSQTQYLDAMMQLGNAGPMGQAIAAREFSQPKMFMNPNTGTITAVNPYSGQAVNEINPGGVNPKLVGTYAQQFNTMDFDTGGPAAVQQGNWLLQQMGQPVPKGGFTAQQLDAFQRGTQTQRAQQAEESARTQFITGPETAGTYASANAANVGAASTAQKTGLAATGAVQAANDNVATLNLNLARLTDAENLTQGFLSGNHTGGKVFQTTGELENAIGKNPQYAAYRDYLATANMQQVITALQHQGRITGNEVTTFNKELLNGSMPLTTLGYLIGQQKALLQSQLMNAQIAAQNTSHVVSAANPSINAAPTSPTSVPQISHPGSGKIVSAAQLQQYAQVHNISLTQAQQYLTGQGYTIGQ